MLGDALRPRDALRGDDLYAARLAAGFAGLLVLCFGLIVLGALVRAHGAGLACPDWPLCFGRLVPRFDLEVGVEWTHRLLAGSVALGFAGLSALCLRRPSTRRAAGRLLALGGALLAAQILLGALTVWRLLASWTVTSHLLVGNAFALSLLLVACALRDAARGAPPRPRPAPALRAALLLAALLLALQMALGGLVSSRFAGLACPEWPTCTGGLWFPSWRGGVGLHLLHRLNAYALLACLAGAALLARRQRPLRALTGLALSLALAQVAVGVANVRLGIPVEVTGLHSALAASLVLCLTLGVRQAWPRAAADGGCYKGPGEGPCAPTRSSRP